MTVFPPRNLPDESEDWGRHIEYRIERVENVESGLVQTSENGGRFTGGQLSVFSSQITEQVDRNTLRINAGSLSVTGSGSVEPFPRATKTIPFTVPSGGRNAQVEIYSRYTLTTPGDVGLYGYVSYQGSIVSKLFNSQITDAGNPLFTPDPWRMVGLTNIQLPESGIGSLEITLIRVGFTGAVSTETLTSIEVYITPFQKTT